MNRRHTIALILIAGAGFLTLVGGIICGVGFVELVQATDQYAIEVGVGFALVGAIALSAGIGLLIAAIRYYRRSDHQLPEIVDAWGVPRRQFPLTAPILFLMFVLLTVLLLRMVFKYGFEWNNFRVVRAYLGWGIMAAVYVVLAIRALINWSRRK